MGLCYKQNNEQKSSLELFSDAVYATDCSRASTTGSLIRYHGATISWTSRLQSSVAEGSAEAELRSLTKGARESLFIVRLQEDILGKLELLILAYEENHATYQNCVTNVSNSRLKHLETFLFKVNEYVKRGIMKLILVGTLQQLADVLTKPLPEQLFTQLINQILFDGN